MAYSDNAVGHFSNSGGARLRAHEVGMPQYAGGDQS